MNPEDHSGSGSKAVTGSGQATRQSGLVTLLFTDVVGSTALKQSLGDRAGVDLVQKHHALVRRTLGEFPGAEEIVVAGDSFLVVFPVPSDAVRCALVLQTRLLQFNQGRAVPVADRMGLHMGEVRIEQTAQGQHNVHGIQVDTCSRVMSLAHGGQILMTRPVFDNARQSLRGEEVESVGSLAWLNHGRFELKGVEEPVEICEVRAGDSPTLSPPKTTEKARRVEAPGEEPVLGWRPAVGQVVPNTQWLLEEKLGEGGFGEVWLGRHQKLKERRVFKFCFRADRVRSLKREMTLFRVLKDRIGDHPGIVRLLEVNFEEPPFYVEEDYVESRDLVSWSATQGGVEKVPPETKLEIVAQIAEALQAAHDAGVIHRDVKPANILVSLLPTPDSKATAKLTDFGIGQVVSEEALLGMTQAGFTQTMLSSSSSQTGTQMYMAPELLAGKPASTRSDIYSLGVVLYQLLVGDFTRPATTDWSRAIEDPLLREDLEHCFAGDPTERFVGAGQLAKNLRGWERRKVERTERERLRARAERRRKLVLAGSAAALVLVLLAVALGYGMRKAQVEREQQRRLAYASDMSLAQQALKLNNLGRTRRLLDRHRPQAGQEDLRGWEWRYLWQLSRSSALVTLTNRPARGWSVSFSPDGSRLAVGWYDGHVDLWDVPARRWIRALTDHDQSHEGQVAFSPVRNLLAATSGAKTVTLYDLDSGRESVLWRAPDQGEWRVGALSFSQDGSRVVIYAGSTREVGDAVWVVNVSSARIESRHPTVFAVARFFGAAQLAPDNRRLYLARSSWDDYWYRIQCIDLAAGKELWQTAPQRDLGLTTLAVSPDGQVLASGSGFEDPAIRIWEAATGRLLVRLEGHTGWVCDLAFTRDGRHLISAATDQSIRLWNARTWTEIGVVRGHTDEVHAVAVSAAAQLVASAGKDGNLMLWKGDGKSTMDGYSRLPEHLARDQVHVLDRSRVLLLPPGEPGELVDLKGASAPLSLPEIGSSTNVLGCFGTNLLCLWNGTNQILLGEMRGAEFVQRGALKADPGLRPTQVAYHATRQLLAWAGAAASTSVHVASLAPTDRRIELRSDLSEIWRIQFSEDGTSLAAEGVSGSSLGLRAWKVEAGQIVVSINVPVRDAIFAAGGRVLVVAYDQGTDHEIGFYDFAHPSREPRLVRGKHHAVALAVSPGGRLVACTTEGAQVRLFDAAKGEWIADLHGHLNAAFGIAFSADGRRLISTFGGREAVKLWDVATQQELLTLSGFGSLLYAARWNAEGDVILAGAPWQAWRAPSWEEIAATEAKEKEERHHP